MRESVLLIPVPEVEDLIGHFRGRFDPSAAEGVPAHVTLLYPFVPPEQIDSLIIQDLSDLFGRTEPFRFDLSALRRFPEALYLSPTPEEPFRAMTAKLVERFPEYPPYGGAYEDVIPHLTIAYSPDRALLDQISAELSIALDRKLPIPAMAREANLMVGTEGIWKTVATFPFRAAV